MSAAIYITVSLESAGACCACGVEFAMPSSLRKKRLADHKEFYCPNGHAQHYTGESEAERLKRELVAANERIDSERKRHEWTRKDLDNQKNVNAGLRGEITKIKHRVGNGVCPCCNRTFTNLRRHMGTKHPGFQYPDVTPPQLGSGK
jgi:hypothetical protein